MKKILFIALLIVGTQGAVAVETRTAVWSPAHDSYVRAFHVPLEGQHQRRNGIESEKLVVYTSDGREVATAHVWLVQPDGTRRAGIRACEDFGWLDSSSVFCDGTVNPDKTIRVIFDAKTGRELDQWEADPVPGDLDETRIK